MLDAEDYRQFLLSRIPGSKKASGGKEVVCKCFYCSETSGHMYISIPNGDKPSQFYCQKCRSRGWVTHKKLLEWGIYDDKMAIELINHNKMSSKSSKKFDSREVYTIFNDYIKPDDLSGAKLRYINNRLGLELTYQDLIQNKIVLNINDVISRNGLKLTRNFNIVNDLDQSFIGFISLDNAFCNMRRLVQPGRVYPSVDKRYVNYALYDKIDNTERFYTVPKNIDLSQQRRIQLHIAEGPFDILSIYYNLRGQSDDIYTCISGNNYKGIIRHFITLMRLPYIEIHLYPDNDKFGSNAVMKDIAEYLKPMQIPMFVHRNVKPGQKDFGTSLSNIEERVSKIL